MKVALIFVTALIVGYSGALVPGPMFTLVVAHSAKHGARSGLFITCGHAVLEFLLLGGLALGLTQVLAKSAVTASISIAGGTVMLAMGGLMVVQSLLRRLAVLPVASPRNQGEVRRYPISLGLRQAGLGIVVSVSNPYFLLWWASIGAAYYVSAAIYGIPGALTFLFGHILADFTWYGALGYVTGYGKRFLGPKPYRLIIMACGIALIGLGIYFWTKGAVRFFS
jgi:threonine/homoserine/homoserine lactone efflux protein